MTDGQPRFHVNVDYRPSIVAPSGEKVASPPMGASCRSRLIEHRVAIVRIFFQRGGNRSVRLLYFERVIFYTGYPDYFYIRDI